MVSKIKSFWWWFVYHFFNKNFRSLRRVLMRSWPWDEGYLYELEQAKIREMRMYHQYHKRFVGVEYVIRDMKLCESLIDIFTEKYLLFHYDRDVTDCMLKGNGSNVQTPKYICDVRVNTKNIDRFIDPNTPTNIRQYYVEHPHELYILKAKHLYHKIRLENDGTWWD